MARLQSLLKEKARRRIDPLTLYEPLPNQQGFHICTAPERVVRGSNRSGKTCCSAAEVARAARNKDPYKKYPERNGRIWIVGASEDHIADTIWPKLFKAGAFKMIRDEVTGEYRAFRPNNLADALRVREAKPMPPLLPLSEIEGGMAGIAWKEKKRGLPSFLRLKTGWEITFFTSKTIPPKGADVDLVWFDEEIIGQYWYSEMAARLLDRGGKFIWSATPEAGTDQLYELSSRAEEQREMPDPVTVEFVLLLEDNEFVAEKEKKLFAAKIIDEEIRRVKIGGEFAIQASRVYPEWGTYWHGFERPEGPYPPRHWTCYASVDPGRQMCAVLFAAVPPPAEGDFVYVFDELYIPNCTAHQFGMKMREKTQSHVYQRFIIDHQGGRHTDGGTGITLENHYCAALRKFKVRSIDTGAGFEWGNPNVKSGVEAVREWLRIREDGKSKLRVDTRQCRNFVEEIKRYRYKRTNGIITDDPETRGRVHLMATLRYLALGRLKWVAPAARTKILSPAYRAFKAKQKREAKGMEGVGFLGPSGAMFGG